MALPLILVVVLLNPLGPILSTALATHNQISPATTTASRHHHHRSPTNTATAHFHPVPSATPSMHQNYLETEESKSLLAVDPFTAEAQASSGEEAMAALGAAATGDARPGLLVPPQASPPPPTLVAAPDLISQAQRQPQEESETNAASTTTTLLPLPNQQTSVATKSPPPPIQGSVAREVSSAGEQGLQQLSRVLTSLGYNEMASAAPLLTNSPPLARWPGAITVFAAPDVFLQASCPTCSRRHLLLQHIAMGYYPYSELAAAPTMKIPSASVGFCLKIVSERGPFGIHYARIYADGVEVSHPELYNDGRYVVHGLHGFLRPLTHSCFDGSHHLTARSAATSTATAASVVRIMIREAIARLRDGGYGFMALAMRVKFAELERFANLTVFALDDQAIFVGGGHDYVSAVRFHIVPEHRLTRADLLRLRPGTILPTLAGEGQNLVVTHVAGSASDDVRINYIPIKESDVVINSRIAVHGVYVPFPRLHLANLAASVAVASAIQMNGTCGVGGPFSDCASSAMTSPKIPAAHGYGEGQ
ncbi:uncharacterized protein LOC104584165 [Brachypodium distachyon]|uniref:FAS1 domain-containing protein n=1 Tax=Brachypodium distachyon TaxID=15368 RepID=A0A0Q3FBW4_BRADI|nr:uncharacterized protein LOC104584165 [Brachypodium distachyon]KQJ97199.1 hypothetical protein BRADI_3g29350v3 [Brachypodium distachyon]|eukprot:XP_014756164.1 uncharacterized protein LOC104584165 [Brachypodium distachyon]